MKSTAFAKIFLLFSCAFALDAFSSEWIEVARYGEHIVKIKYSSVSKGKTKNGNIIVIGDFERVSVSKNDVILESKFVSFNDCAKGYGELVTTNLDGKYLYKTDFIFDGSSVASGVAEFLCKAYKIKYEENMRAKEDQDAKTKWKETIDEFIKTEASRQDGIDYTKNKHLLDQLDEEVKRIARIPDNNNKTMLWFLIEADRAVREKNLISR